MKTSDRYPRMVLLAFQFLQLELSLLLGVKSLNDELYHCFTKSLIIHEDKTKEITNVKEVWIYGSNYIKIW